MPCGEGVMDFQAMLDAVPDNRKEKLRYVIDQDASKGDITEDLVRAMHYLNVLHM